MFPPLDSSLYIRDKPRQGLEWKRPHEILPDPKFFVKGVSRFDISQGELGDCWLAAAIASLTMHTNLFAKVVPPGQTFTDDYAGDSFYRKLC